MKYRLAIFDFDGVLADSFPFFVSVFNDLAARHGFKRIESQRALELRGYDARQLMTHLGLPAWKLPIVAKDFVALVSRNVARIPLFDRIEEVLLHLEDAGMRLAIVSSNSQENIVRILGERNAALIDRFECGMSIFGKASRLRNVLRDTAVATCEAIYIGDQVTDLEAARQEGIAFGAVAWGYGTLESLCAQGPQETFHDVFDIKSIA